MLAYLFVVLAVAFRFFPHLWGMTPVGASLLFFGARGPRKQWYVPVLLMATSDVVLTKWVYHYRFAPADYLLTFAWYAAMIGLGGLLRDNARPLRIFGACLTMSVSFFLISNFAVWLGWTMYPKTLAGLIQCYTLALPFFRRELLGDFLFTAVFFAAPALARLATSAMAKPGDHSAPA